MLRTAARSLVAMLAFAVFSSAVARAEVTVFGDRASFESAAGPLSRETFEELRGYNAHAHVAKIGGVSYQAIDASPAPGNTWFVTMFHTPYYPSGALTYAIPAPHQLTFTDGQPVMSFGLALCSPLSSPSPGDVWSYPISVLEADGRWTYLTSTHSAADPRKYVGFTSAKGIREVRVQPGTSPSSGWGYNLYYEEVSWSRSTAPAIPEPSSMALLLGSLSLVAAARRGGRPSVPQSGRSA